ncbi:MAG: UDP-N-acetylglucosamine 2-epimerase (non-hydrolyzing) [Bacteroidia bacterium]|nr:UDP-N-acetylglucosamine 2-epimerase (non-hydrolyzing) [Bacteroidia bacterium]NND25702.1 UDP-N-acetylglucosamine 2-epimerase (non-hydrolyzing) [Flavobacteriaceae bacterium]MBT8279232.1 UDP-N-acetylglucosamine 2-epimerase (non-hydrolyzing) [Bacteroidia bacterium]NNK59768.1 UDP-N-acetylglucosamine 2-epimerase (non-hydrolyzing) [Flavobacteriaceae bacterium]NNL32032.1 UDP-N-acetylglucosamine 2-epimerase (non-hydrolyzing) [Flavobacteriaceae bacterium]
MKLTIVAGARPNFMKIAPIIRALDLKASKGFEISFRLVHTGQHYDKNLSDTFFEELNIPYPDINLDVKSGTQAEQTAAIMIAFESDLEQHPSDLVIVVGDVTSTMACTIVAKKMGVKVAHVEAGIRSGDMRMPEEINRIVTDSLTDYFFTTSKHANSNLIKLGVAEHRIFFVGNVMIDTLKKHQKQFNPPAIWSDIDLKPQGYLVMTLHRPSNVDEEIKLKTLISSILSQSNNIPIIFPVHPRTKHILERLKIQHENLHCIEPLGYFQFNYLVQHALGVLTDSGGITEETTVMNVPCITLRENTERPETCEIGTNILVGHDLDLLGNALRKMVNKNWKSGEIPELWDGHAAERIVDHIVAINRNS